MSNNIAEQLSQLLLVPDNGMKSQVGQVSHRLDLIDVWGGIPSGAKVLELGCGQGDCTIALAHAVGKNGFIAAVDPAPPGYGSPFTVEEAQKHISGGSLGQRVKWISDDPFEFLPKDSLAPIYDIGILAHCLWYFHSPSVIRETLKRLGTTCKQVYVAEWSLSASRLEGVPHVLASLAQASLEFRKEESNANIRTTVSPDAIKKLAQEAGLEILREGNVLPKSDLFDGKWEVGAVSGLDFVKEVEEVVADERERGVVFALRDSMIKSIDVLEGGRKAVCSMDVWCGVFKKV